MRLIAIAALADNWVIGKDNQLPWHLPRDLKFFKDMTSGCPIISGRKTFESHGVLPKRRNIIMTQQDDYGANGAETAQSWDEALAKVAGEELVFILGGEGIFRDAVERYATDLVLTRVHADYEGDTYFPIFDEAKWELVWEAHHAADAKNPVDMTFQRWLRTDDPALGEAAE
jgi:dihydrofolate reductase